MHAVIEGLCADDMRLEGGEDIGPSVMDEPVRQVTDQGKMSADTLLGAQIRKVPY